MATGKGSDGGGEGAGLFPRRTAGKEAEDLTEPGVRPRNPESRPRGTYGPGSPVQFREQEVTSLGRTTYTQTLGQRWLWRVGQGKGG